jgi:hypothetical protein
MKGVTLATYPPARAVIAAHASHLGRQEPTFSRWSSAAVLAGYLTGARDERNVDRNVGLPAAERQRMVNEYASILNRPDWTAVARARLRQRDAYRVWVARATRRIALDALTDLPDDEDRPPEG